eukprot:6212640-Amphidinium_carterae.1
MPIADWQTLQQMQEDWTSPCACVVVLLCFDNDSSWSNALLAQAVCEAAKREKDCLGSFLAEVILNRIDPEAVRVCWDVEKGQRIPCNWQHIAFVSAARAQPVHSRALDCTREDDLIESVPGSFPPTCDRLGWQCGSDLNLRGYEIVLDGTKIRACCRSHSSPNEAVSWIVPYAMTAGLHGEEPICREVLGTRGRWASGRALSDNPKQTRAEETVLQSDSRS